MFPGAATTGFHVRVGLMQAIGGSAQSAIATDRQPPARGTPRRESFERIPATRIGHGPRDVVDASGHPARIAPR